MVPVKIWTDDIDDKSKAQLRNMGSLPFVHHHVAAMPDVHLGPEGSDHSDAYIHAVHWAQSRITPCRIGSRCSIWSRVPYTDICRVLRVSSEVVNCHHNYVAQEHHYRANVWVTRKGANGPRGATTASYRAAWKLGVISSG